MTDQQAICALRDEVRAVQVELMKLWGTVNALALMPKPPQTKSKNAVFIDTNAERITVEPVPLVREGGFDQPPKSYTRYRQGVFASKFKLVYETFALAVYMEA